MTTTRPQWGKVNRHAAKMKRAHNLILRYIAGNRVSHRRLKKWNRAQQRAWVHIQKAVGIWSGERKALR